MILRRQRRASVTVAPIRAAVESLESRTLLSAAYVLTDLGLLPSATDSWATAINASGIVVGAQNFNATDTHAFRWTNTQGLQDLGTLPGDADAVANAINALGTVVGASGNMFTFNTKGSNIRIITDGHAFLWTTGGGMQDLGVLPGFTSSQATGINSSGEVVGYCTSGQTSQAFMWTAGGGMQALAGATPSEAMAVNDDGQIAGTVNSYPTRWSAAGQAQTLVGNQFGVADAINSTGDVVGENPPDATLWTDPATMQSLGLIPGIEEVASIATSINASNQVVGSGIDGGGEDAGSFAGGGFFWSASTGLEDLDAIVGPTSHPDFTILSASGINDNGLIAASGYNAEFIDHAYLLTPAALAPATQLVFTSQPSNAPAGQTLLPINVAVEDQSGDILTSDTSNVTLSIASPANGTLNGTLTAPVQNGIATFSTISVPATGAYTILASDGIEGAAISASFDATAPATGTAAVMVSLSSDNILLSSPTESATLTAMVSPVSSGGAAATGVITFLDNGVPLGAPMLVAAGMATLSNSTDLPLPLGSDSITAAYSGDGTYLAATSAPVVETVTNNSPVAPFPSGKLPSLVIAGQKTTISQTLIVTDQGDTPYKGLETIHFFLTQGNVDSNSIELPDTVSKVFSIAPHKSVRSRLVIKSLPANVPPGSYFIVGYGTDNMGNTNVEASGNNVRVAAPVLDLSGSFTKLPAGFKVSKKASISLIVNAAGNIPASGMLAVTLDASMDGTLDQNAVAIPTLPVRINIKPGKSAVIHLNRLTLPAGTYVLFATLDPNNVFADSNLMNNTFVSPTVTVA